MLTDISVVKSCIKLSSCSVIIDLDETIFNPLERWRRQISEEMNVDFSVRDIERAGSLDDYFVNTPRYKEFVNIVERLRADESLYHGLPTIDGAATAISRIGRTPGLRVCAYLTARPATTVEITRTELERNGFPIMPILARPSAIEFMSSVQWKLSVLETITEHYEGTIIMIDDKAELAISLRERNKKASNIIVSILFMGPLTYTYVERERLVTQANEHFYVASWGQIPDICSKYASGVLRSPNH